MRILAVGLATTTLQSPPSARAQPPEVSEHRLSLKPLDLSQVPTTDELMAAGQLGGPLVPTRECKDDQRDAAARLDFGRAIEEWNQHHYPKAVALFRRYVKDFPDSPWAAEAELHIGCDATYNGRYTEAQAIFEKLIGEQQGKVHEGARMMLGKARQRLAVLKVEQNNLEEAGAHFAALLDSPDWRHRTYASHWIQRLSRYKSAKQALLTCGVDALAYALDRFEQTQPGLALTAGVSLGERAASLRTKVPATMRGHSLHSLVTMAAEYGHDLIGLELASTDLPRLPLPAILHIVPRHTGDLGHFWVLDKVEGERVELFDPQSERRFRQTTTELAQEWTGKTLVIVANPAVRRPGFRSLEGGAASLPGRRLDISEMEDNSGGCCGEPPPEDDLGDACKKPGNPACKCKCSEGSPRWTVNVVNLNLFVTDTPLWYDPPIGPPVSIILSYNSLSATEHHEPFGNKWQFNYGSYLVVDPADTVLLFMPDGRRDVFSPDGVGGYRRPYQVFNTLTRLAENHFELRFPDGVVYVYRIPPGTSSQQPFLTEIRDAYNQRLLFGYDANVHLTTITAADGKVFTLSYDANGLCTEVADPFGRSARFEHDAHRNLLRISDMGGYSSSFTYDPNVNLTSLSDERGTWEFWIEPADHQEAYSNDYPPPGDLMWESSRMTVTNPSGGKEEYMYFGGGDEYGEGYTWYVSPRDYVPWESSLINNFQLRVPKTRYFFRGMNSGRRGEFSKILYPEGDSVQYGYDLATGDRISETDAHGHIQQYALNSMGRVTSTIDAQGTPTAFIYAANGVDLLSVSNGLGAIRMTYNAQHDLVSLTDRLTNTTTFAYNTNGQILSQVDALGITNEYLYGPDQRLAEFRRAGQTLERFTYDAVGRVRTRTDATGLTVTNDYNPLNQVVRVTYPDGRFESYAYSTCCPRLLDSVTDRGGRTTAFIHDALKRLIQTVNPEGGITQFGYDANGNRTSLTDPNGNVTTFTYDLDNRLIRKTYADGKGLSFGYDQAGLLTTRTNARGITTTYTYDANHNLLTTTYSDDTPGVTNTYDAFNRLTHVLDGVGTNAYAYDANSRLVSSDGPWADDTITYAFDALGRRTNLVVQGSQPTGYAYDSLNRLTGVRVGAQTYAYTYAAGASPMVQRLDRPNGSFTTYQYDGLNRLTILSNRRSTSEVINEFLYTYNAQDLRDTETVNNGLALTLTNQCVTYDYNRLNQLLTAAPPSQAFAYDADGNMTRGFTPDGNHFTATYYADSRLKSVAVTDNGTLAYQFTYRYGWLDFVAQSQQYHPGQGTNEIRYVRNRYAVVQERDSTNALLREYAWSRQKAGGIGSLLNLRYSGRDYSFLYDGKGNVASALNDTQLPAAAYAYDEFGSLVAASENISQPFGFSTKPYNRFTGFSDFGFRFYSVAHGRWLSRDPLGELGGINLYGFSRNSPVNFVDPLGLIFEQIWDDPNQRARHKCDAISPEDFLDYARGKSLSDLQNEETGGGTSSTAGGPSSHRYVVDPANPNQVIDMRHFLVVGPQGEFVGLVGEVLQRIQGYSDSAFDAQDFLSNKLGSDFFGTYDPKKNFDDQLREFFDKRRNSCQ